MEAQEGRKRLFSAAGKHWSSGRVEDGDADAAMEVVAELVVALFVFR